MTPDTIHSCTNPQRTRIENRQIGNITRWSDPKYKTIEAKFLNENPVCIYCGRPATVAHHDEDWMYATEEAYYDPVNMTPACGSCHDWYRRGYVVCPFCKKSGEIHYMKRGAESCHLHKLRQGRKLRHRRHSCDWNNGNQRCGNPLRHDRVCPYSARDAENRCDHFMARRKKQGATK